MKGNCLKYSKKQILILFYFIISRKNPYGLIVAPDTDVTNTTTQLFIDEGDDIDYLKNSTIIDFSYVKVSIINIVLIISY